MWVQRGDGVGAPHIEHYKLALVAISVTAACRPEAASVRPARTGATVSTLDSAIMQLYSQVEQDGRNTG